MHTETIAALETAIKVAKQEKQHCEAVIQTLSKMLPSTGEAVNEPSNSSTNVVSIDTASTVEEDKRCNRNSGRHYTVDEERMIMKRRLGGKSYVHTAEFLAYKLGRSYGSIVSKRSELRARKRNNGPGYVYQRETVSPI